MRSLYDLQRIDFELVSVTYDSSTPITFQVKNRNNCELVYKLEGEAEEYFPDRHLTLATDTVMFIPETERENTFVVTKSGKIINIRFHFTGETASMRFAPEIIKQPPGNRYKSLFISAFDEWQKKDAGSYMRTHSIVSSILAGLISERNQQYMQSGKYTIIRPALAFVDENYKKPITVEMLSKLCGISDEYLRVLIKRYTGMPPLAYVNSKRLEAAYEMLLTGSATVIEAAEACGFESASYFSRLFKRRYHLSPGRVHETKITLPNIFPKEEINP